MKYLFFLFLSAQLFSQNVIDYEGEKINELTLENKKTGLWKIIDHERGIIINCNIADDLQTASIEYYRYGKLIASQSNEGNMIFYKGSERIYGKLIHGKNPKIIKDNGEELDAETSKLFFETSQVKPLFYGSDEALRYALLKNINKANTKDNYGKVKVKFVIDTNGIIESPEVIESDNALLNEEAIKIIKSLPRWQPGFQQGHFVKCTYTFPLNFGTKPK